MPALRFLLIFTLLVLCGRPATAGTLTTIFAFPGPGTGSGSNPNGVTFDDEGNIYGAATYGGACEYCGLIYKLKKPAPGQTKWTFEVIHRFLRHGYGFGPTSPLTFKAGSIYGMTERGKNCRGRHISDPCGTVYKLTESGGSWRYSILHRFGADRLTAGYEYSRLTVEDDGTIYGSRPDTGVIFKIDPSGTYSLLHQFAAYSVPVSDLIIGQDGAIYGTELSASDRTGHAYRLSTSGQYKILHYFRDRSGEKGYAIGQLALGPDGTIYGTEGAGGSHYAGVVWSLTPPQAAGQDWTYKELYSFTRPAGDVAGSSRLGVIIDNGGRLFGASNANDRSYPDSIFKLAPSGADWKYSELAQLSSQNGPRSLSELTLRSGILYGTTQIGGVQDCGDKDRRYGCGTVFMYSLQ